ncbi:hypothetical protein SNEBB_010257 [Seison nebaliae]|nr:hypothetical protein SNEBB_010257 [Seison nebaliae]
MLNDLPGGNHMGMFTAAIFIIGEMAGSGVLALPLALSETGWYGIGVILLCAVMSCYCGIRLSSAFQLIYKNQQNFNVEIDMNEVKDPYPIVGQVVLGKFGRLSVSILINSQFYGASIVFLLLAAQNIESVALHYDRNFPINFCSLIPLVACVLLPLCWMERLKNVKAIGYLASISTLVACIIIVIHIIFIDWKSSIAPTYHQPNLTGFFFGFGTIIFSLSGSILFPTIQVEMKDQNKFYKSAILGFVGLLLMYLPVSIAGYALFGTDVKSNILQSISPDLYRISLQLLIAIHLLSAFIIVINPVFQHLEMFLPNFEDKSIRKLILRCTLRTIIVGSCVFIGSTLPNFAIILSLIGATGVIVSFIYPLFFYYKLHERDFIQKKIEKMELVLMILISLIALIAGVFGIYSGCKQFTTTHFTYPCYVNATAVQISTFNVSSIF